LATAPVVPPSKDSALPPQEGRRAEAPNTNPIKFDPGQNFNKRPRSWSRLSLYFERHSRYTMAP